MGGNIEASGWKGGEDIPRFYVDHTPNASVIEDYGYIRAFPLSPFGRDDGQRKIFHSDR
jgi:hypothetical protein